MQTTTTSFAPSRRDSFIPSAADIEAFSPLVRQVVARFVGRMPPNVLRDDLMAAGMLGLVDALRRQRGERNDGFACYARVRIRGAIVDELRAEDWLSRRDRERVSRATPSTPPRGPVGVIGFDDMTEAQSEARLGDESSPNALDLLEACDERAAIARALEALPERERGILQDHYFRGVAFKEIARQLGVSEPRVSQLHSRAVRRLREMLGGEDEPASTRYAA